MISGSITRPIARPITRSISEGIRGGGDDPLPPVDFTALEDALNDAAQLDGEDYTTTSWAGLQSVVDAGQIVLNNPDATQQQVDDAAQAILDAIDNLVLFSPEYLFDNNETGFNINILPGNFFTDAEMEAPATFGDPVYVAVDSSGNDNNVSQVTMTARPIFGRVPRGGRRNLLNNTENRGSFWNYAAGISRQSEAAETPGGYRADRITLVGSTGHEIPTHLAAPLAPGEYTVSLLVYFENLPAGYSFQLAYYDGGSSIAPGAATVTPGMVGAWVRLSAVISVPETVVASPRIRFNGYGAGSEGTSYLFGEPQAEPNTGVTPYQSVTSQYDITESGVPDVYYLDFDLIDDLISTTLPAISNGTLVIAGTGGIWIDDDYNFAGGTFSIGITSYTGGPEGILGVVGDLLVGGSFVIDRQLTAEERTRVINKLKGMGAPGVFELGPELVVNGDFSDGLTGWTAFLDGGGGPIPGGLRLEFSSDNARVQQADIILPNELYYGSFRILSSDSTGVTRIKTNLGNNVSATLAASPSGSPPGIYAGVGFSNTSNISVFAGGTRPLSVDITDVSIRKLELIP